MFFEKFFPKLPTVKAQEEEEELVDPQQVLREKCNEKDVIAALREKYEACNTRVNSRSRTTEICSEELNDWLHALDHCVAHTLFSKLNAHIQFLKITLVSRSNLSAEHYFKKYEVFSKIKPELKEIRGAFEN